MSCSESCGPKPTCMKYMAMVKARDVPTVRIYTSPEEKAFWDPQIDQFSLGQCEICKNCRVDYRVPRFFWSPHYDRNGTIFCKCKKCGTDAMIARRL